jgi:hypothetical protein
MVEADISEEIFDELVQDFLDSLVSQETFSEAIIWFGKNIAGKLKLNPNNPNPAGKVVTYCATLQGLLAEAGIDKEDVNKDPQKFGQVVRTLISAEGVLDPPEIRAWFKHLMDGELNGCITYAKFSDILEDKIRQIEAVALMRELALVYEFAQPVSAQEERILRKRKQQDGKNLNSHGHKKPRNDDHARHQQKPNVGASTSSSSSQQNAKGGSKKEKDKKDNECWGCKSKDHSLRECPTVTDESVRERIVDAKRALFRKNKGNDSQYIDCSFNLMAVGNPSVVTAYLNGKEMDVLLDNGSDRSIISKKCLMELQSKGMQIELNSINPVEITLADPSARIHTASYVKIHITLKVYENLTLRDRIFYVVEQDVERPIVGHSELAELGIDPNSTLERLSYKPPDLDQDDEISSEEYEHITSEFVSQTLDLAIHQMLKRAQDNGMPEEWWKELCKIVWKHKDVFRVSLLKDPPADVSPMNIRFKTGAQDKTWKSYNRKYTQEEYTWLKSHIETLEKYGFIYRNPDARYVSPALVVPKPGSPGEFRLCVDVKRPNELVLQTHWPMPNIDVVLRKLSKSSVYAKLDAFKGYWLFPTTTECGELYSIKTPFGVFTPTRIIQGAQDAVKYFQAGMEEALDLHQRDDLLLWVDDILAHASSPKELVESLNYVFRRCRDRKIRLSAKKCDLFLRSVTWCGRNISSDGIRFDPEYIQGIQNLDEPKTVGDLQKYICSLNWIRTCIPHYNQEVEPLTECLRLIIEKIGTNKKNILARRMLSQFMEWDDAAKDCFRKSKDLVKSAIIATHYDPKLRLCVFPDASEDHWGLFITQAPREDMNLPFEQQRHKPLSMLSGSFKGSSKKWHIREKEAYPIMVALDKMRDLLKNPDGFALFTDHKNLVWVLDPEGRQVVKHADDRLSRWSLQLMTFKFSVEHIAGESNVVADMLSRWRIEYPQTVCGARFEPGNCSVMHKEDFIWPSIDEIANAQRKLKDHEIASLKLMHKSIQNKEILVAKKSECIYIPDGDLRVRLCVIAHTGLAGHRRIKTTYESLKKKFYWPKMMKDVQEFCKLCLHCSVADSQEIIPRPLGEQIHATERNQILHYDFIHIGASEEGFMYLLVIKDDYSGYVDLIPCETPNSDTVIKALLRWYGMFGISLVHVSDQGSHFKNSVIAELNRRLTTKHHFTLPYAPWSNGTVEIVNKALRKLLKVWISEFRLVLKQWPSLVPLMIHVINFTASDRLHGFPPALVFGGFSTVNNLDFIVEKQEFRTSTLNFTELSKQVEELKNAFDKLHKKIDETESRRGNYSMLRNRPNFDKGDYVMFATRQNYTGPSRRSRPCWTGPYKLLECKSDWEYVIQHLVTGDKFSAHSSRLKYYCDKDLNVTADLKFQITHDEMRYTVKNFSNHRSVDGNFEFLTQWEGFDEEDSTWEPITTLFEDVPKLCQKYVLSISNKDKNKKLLNKIVGL